MITLEKLLAKYSQRALVHADEIVDDLLDLKLRDEAIFRKLEESSAETPG